ncbi:hypothetical protein LIA75_001859 [Vibrio fluvialis]|nr:hypothetical protein [Vibrio fluvialis]EKO3490858.1 hypothetical protein [Vibrio fluvialis]EKO3548421.1 hypothetical protein [Vibrio fluvialis]EKO3554794.1 hypothetical protein [Vibrio fluvialis]ELI1809568.1 hypothetical protein [Vibrio fluvialis]
MASISIAIPNPNAALKTQRSKASNDDLSPLVDYLKKKLSEDLTCYEAYKKHAPNHQKYYGVIAKEICDIGGNLFVNVWCKEVPSYNEIVYDVAKKLKVTVSKSDSVVDMENAVKEKLLTDAIG